MHIPTTKDEVVNTWPAFYHNPAIKHLSAFRAWSITDPSNKMPLAFNALLNMTSAFDITGMNAKENAGTLNDVISGIPNAVNNALYLNGFDMGYVVVDIEPTADDATKNRLLGLPWIYAETSMSGKGIHLIIDYPYDLMRRYPNAALKSVLKSPDNTWEVLICNHWVTFTRNAINPPRTHSVTIDEILEPLVSSVKAPVDHITLDDLPAFDEIPLSAACRDYIEQSIVPFKRDAADYAYDLSRYDSGCATYFMSQLLRTLRVVKHDLTIEDIIVLVLHFMEQYGSPRDKWYNHFVNGSPWIIYTIKTAYEHLTAQQTSSKDTK